MRTVRHLFIAPLTACVVVSGLAGGEPAKTTPPAPSPAPTEAQIAAITYDDASEDQGFVTPLAENLDRFKDDPDTAKRFAEFRGQLDKWAPGKVADLRQRTRNLLGVAALADLGQGEFEPETAWAVLEKLKKDVPKDQLIPALAAIILHPAEGTVLKTIPDLGMDGEAAEDDLRERVGIYAKKLLGRLLGKLPPK